MYGQHKAYKGLANPHMMNYF